MLAIASLAACAQSEPLCTPEMAEKSRQAVKPDKVEPDRAEPDTVEPDEVVLDDVDIFFIERTYYEHCDLEDAETVAVVYVTIPGVMEEAPFRIPHHQIAFGTLR